MSKASEAKREKIEAIEKLRDWVKPGDTVYTILRHVSASGMMRKVSVVLIDVDQRCDSCGRSVVRRRPVPCVDCGAPATSRRLSTTDTHPNWSVAKAIGLSLDRKGPHDSIIVHGCGTDVGFEVVYNLGRVLFGDGWTCIGEGCPSNDHSNGDRNYEPHTHTDGGYALRQRWL